MWNYTKNIKGGAEQIWTPDDKTQEIQQETKIPSHLNNIKQS